MPRMKDSQFGQPKPGNIQLIIYQPTDNTPSAYLEIPISHIQSLCRHPLKYLRYVGWSIIGVEGHVGMDSPESVDNIGDDGELEDQGVYRYRIAEGGGNPLGHAINLDVYGRSSGASRHTIQSQVSSDRQDFQERLRRRDLYCVISGINAALCEASHIIPFASGHSSIQSIVANRNNYGEDVSGLTSIDDVRNGMLVGAHIHSGLDSRRLAFLKTPNHVLNTNDIEINDNRVIRDGTEYPADERITLQIIEIMEEQDRSVLVRVCDIGYDAAFAVGTHIPKPSALLLHYQYGAAALRWWGHHTDALRPRKRSRPRKRPRPSSSDPGPSDPGPSYLTGRPMTVGRRTTAIKKREAANIAGGSKTKRGRPQEKAIGYKNSNTVDLVDEPVGGWMDWDDDDWMEFFLYNTKAAREHRQAAEEESSTNIRAWAQNISDSQSTEL